MHKNVGRAAWKGVAAGSKSSWCNMADANFCNPTYMTTHFVNLTISSHNDMQLVTKHHRSTHERSRAGQLNSSMSWLASTRIRAEDLPKALEAATTETKAPEEPACLEFTVCEFTSVQNWIRSVLQRLDATRFKEVRFMRRYCSK